MKITIMSQLMFVLIVSLFVTTNSNAEGNQVVSCVIENGEIKNLGAWKNGWLSVVTKDNIVHRICKNNDDHCRVFQSLLLGAHLAKRKVILKYPAPYDCSKNNGGIDPVVGINNLSVY